MTGLVRYLIFIYEAKTAKERVILIVGLLAIFVVTIAVTMSMRSSRQPAIAADIVPAPEIVAIYDHNPPITGTIALNTPVTGDLTRGGTDVWTFTGKAGTAITVFLESAWANHLTLGAPEEFGPFAEAYNDLGGGTAIICNKALSASGTYRLYVQSSVSRPNQTLGPYTLRVTYEDPALSPAPVTAEVSNSGAALVVSARSPCLPG